MFENPNYLWILFALPVAWAICIWAVNQAYRVASIVSTSAAIIIIALLLARPTWNSGIGVEHPVYLWLLALLPLLWFFSFKSLAGLGKVRRLLALTLRSLVFTAMVMALANAQFRRTSEQLTVIYLLDQSESIPEAKREMMLRYVVDEVAAHRQSKYSDQAGVIVFGRDALIEIPPFDDDIPSVGSIEARLGSTDATNLESALKLAQASFPEGSMRRIVIVTDGNENIGNARDVAPQLAANGIGIDAVSVKLSNRAEGAIEKVAIPSQIREGQPFDIQVVVANYADQLGDGGDIEGKVRLVRKVGNKRQLITEADVVVPPGKKILTVPYEINEPGAYTYEATFVPNDPNDDLMAQNNRASAFTHVRGEGRVLLIEDSDTPGEFDYLVGRLQANKIEVDVMPSNQLFTSLAELQAYDSVILANVPRSSGQDEKTVTSFSDEQIAMLVRNTEQFGAGLVMLGGPNAFGAGGWSNTELEKAMPVDFQIKNAKVQAVGALVLMMHASEMAKGNYWQKIVGVEAIKALGPMDYCGLVQFGIGGDSWLWGGNKGLLRVQGNRKMMLGKLNAMTPGDMPDFEPAMKMALRGFNRVNASVNHMIIISDGDPSPPRQTTMNQFINFRNGAGVKISTVAVGTHGPAGSTPLQNIARATGGKYYVVKDPRVLPKIYQREARKVARPLVYERDVIQPLKDFPHEILSGIDNVPPIKGFVLTTRKENPLVQVGLYSQQPDATNGTILAAWEYKAGRAAVLTTDTGKRWANNWTEWDGYDKLFTQLVNWSMRPIDSDSKFTVDTNIKDGKVRVVVTALNKEDEFLNFLSMSGAAVGPDLKPFDINMRQTAPGRYVGEFAAGDAGSYYVSVNPGDKYGTIRSGVDVPYSSEFKSRETNRALLQALAAVAPEGGAEGIVIDSEFSSESDVTSLLQQADTFRRQLAKAISVQSVWQIFALLAACVFFADVFIRRVMPSYDWVRPGVDFVREKMLKQERNEAVDASIERLRSQKAAIQSQLDEKRAATRFEPTADADAAPPPPADLGTVMEQATGAKPTAPPSQAPPDTMTPQTSDQDDDYTARLLAAKKKAFKDK